MMSTDLGGQASELLAKLEASKSKNESLKARREEIMKESLWNMDLTKADLAQLVAAKKALEQVRILRMSAGDVDLNYLVTLPSSSSVVPIPDMGAGTSTVPDMGLGTSTVQDMGVGAGAAVSYQYQAPYADNFN